MENLNFNEKQMKERLTERILHRINNGLKERAEISKDNNQSIDLKPLIDSHNIMDVEYFSHRRILGKLIIFSKRALRKLLSPILMRQIHFNQRVIDHLYIIDHKITSDNTLEENYKQMTIDIVDEIVCEMKVLIDASINKEEYHNEIEELRQSTLSLSSEILEMKNNNPSLRSNILCALLNDLAKLENDNGKKYHLLLMALNENPDDLDLEARVLSAFESMNKSRLNTNESV
ncbi:hypothetical protein [Paenibacillus crassostreae]|uniref:Uncharacterized protein n=1 Tax=Paenibacillus crassostreae TaxID=1763538 RepID=A0A167E2E6_9BACL|nr:hypothetical protein [Paenibacillus crassostreae]AOZ93300.1 hypothetical protein LPB68_14485 [Paenibacillus crassostreae]OAB75055.1 hypothetical protein PNBC_09450 [Paenibacillus crassostreae]